MKTIRLPALAACLSGGTLLVILLTACGPSKPAKKPASEAAKPVETEAPVLITGNDSLLNPSLQQPLTEADKAFNEIAKFFETPPFPPEWQAKEPTPEEIAAFKKRKGLEAGEVAAKAKEFYTKYPDHPQAAQVKQQESALLNAAIRLGNTNAQLRLEALETERLNDPKLDEDDRFELRLQQVQRSVPEHTEDNAAASVKAMEAGVRALQKEFPKRPEIAELLLSVAQEWSEHDDFEKSKKIVQEVLKSEPTGETADEAKTLLKRLERVGQPLALKAKAIDGRDIDLQQMKGKVVLVNFWATWDDDSMAELPKLKAVYEKLSSKGFEIVGISFDREKAALESVLQGEKVTWLQHLDNEKLGDEFGIASLPTMWLVDKKGNLRDLNAVENLATKVEKLLAE